MDSELAHRRGTAGAAITDGASLAGMYGLVKNGVGGQVTKVEDVKVGPRLILILG